MKFFTVVLWALVLVVTNSRVAQAADEITVVVTGTGSGRPFTVTFDANEAINAANGLPTIASTDTRVNIYSTSSLASAGQVTFVANSRSADLEVFVGTGSFPISQLPLTNAVTNWAGIAPLPSALVDRVRIAGALSGNLTGSVNVKEVFRLEVNGQLSAAVEASGSGTSIGVIEFGSSTAAGTISATNGDIGRVEALTTNAVIAGAIAALNGKIQTINAAGGISISASPGISCTNEIGIINAAGKDISAIISAGFTLTTQGVYAIRCRDFAGSVTGNAFGENGTATQSLIATRNVSADITTNYDLRTPIEVSGDMTGDITTGENVLAPITVDGEITGNIEIGTSSNGGNLSETITGLYGIKSVVVHGDVERTNEFFPVRISAPIGDIGEIIVEGSALPIVNLEGHDVEIVCGGVLEYLETGRSFAGVIRKPTTPYYVDCGVLLIGTSEVEGFIGGDLWIEKFTTFDVWENISGPIEDGDKLHLKERPSRACASRGQLLGT